MTLRKRLSTDLFSSASKITGKSINSLDSLFIYGKGVELYLLNLDQRPPLG